eukprot:COSAG05_NODE_768_length_7455_cov_4.609027_4_plen_79_part_00
MGAEDGFFSWSNGTSMPNSRETKGGSYSSNLPQPACPSLMRARACCVHLGNNIFYNSESKVPLLVLALQSKGMGSWSR